MPGRTISNSFYYGYVLESSRDHKQYTGYTSDLRKRMEQHRRGKSFTTAPQRPFTFTYHEACRSLVDAKRREEYLKGTGGRRYPAERLRDYYERNNSKLY